MAGWKNAGAFGVTRWCDADAACARGIAIVGNYFAVGGDSVGDVAAACAGFSSREFGRADEQHSGGAAHGNYCAVGIRDVGDRGRVGARGAGARKSA